MNNPPSTIEDIKQARFESWVEETFGRLTAQSEIAKQIQKDTLRGGVLRSRAITTPDQALEEAGVKIDKDHGVPFVENSDGSIVARLDGLGHMIIELKTKINEDRTMHEKFVVYPESQDKKTVRLDVVDGVTQYDFDRPQAFPDRMDDTLGVYVTPGNEHYDHLATALASEPGNITDNVTA